MNPGMEQRFSGAVVLKEKNRVVYTRGTAGSFKIIFRNYGNLTKHL